MNYCVHFKWHGIGCIPCRQLASALGLLRDEARPKAEEPQ